MLFRSSLLSIVLSLFAAAAQAATYVPTATKAGQSGLSFSIPYTLGVHTGVTTVAQGELAIDPVHLEINSGEILFPIASLESGNVERNCHMSEALGIDYAKSDYPNKHVCSTGNLLPTDGPNAVVFPQIRFLFRSFQDGKVTGTFSMHGVDKELTVPVIVTAVDGGKMNVKSTFVVHLSDFGVVVKKVLIVSVGNDATVNVDLTLEPKAAAL